MDQDKNHHYGRNRRDGDKFKNNDREDKDNDKKYDYKQHFNKKPYGRQDKFDSNNERQADEKDEMRNQNYKQYRQRPYNNKIEAEEDVNQNEKVYQDQGQSQEKQSYQMHGDNEYRKYKDKPYRNKKYEENPNEIPQQQEKFSRMQAGDEFQNKRSSNFEYDPQRGKGNYEKKFDKFKDWRQNDQVPDRIGQQQDKEIFERQPKEQYRGKNFTKDVNPRSDDNKTFKTKDYNQKFDNNSRNWRDQQGGYPNKPSQKQPLTQEAIQNKQQQKQQFFQDLTLVHEFCKNQFGFAIIRENDQSWLHVNYTQLLLKDQLNKLNSEMKRTLFFLVNFVKGHINLPRENNSFNEYEQNYLLKVRLFITNITNLKKKVDNLINTKVQQITTNSQMSIEDDSLQNDKELEQFENKFDNVNDSRQINQMEEEINQQGKQVDLNALLKELKEDNQQDDEISLQVIEQRVNNDDEDELSSELDESDKQSDNQMQDDSKQFTQEQHLILAKFYVAVLKQFIISLKMEKAMLARNLPSYEIKQSLLQQIENSKNPFTLLIGTTGSGKTTQIPQYLLQNQILSENYYKKIYCVQPKKINCLSISERVAQELSCKLGEEVGYIVGYSKHEQLFDSSKTRIIFITQTMFLSLLVSRIKICSSINQTLNECPLFSKVGYILLDEVHERTVEADIIMGLLKSIFNLDSKLKIILSSATVNIQSYLNFYQVQQYPMQLCQIPGKLFEIEEVFCNNIYGNNVKKVVKVLKNIITKIQEGDPLHQGHILIFLTDTQEIEECISECRKLTCIDFRKYALLALHNKSERDDQNKVFQDLINPYTNEIIVKIIFATNIAESAITINNVTIVIDSGKEKCLVYDPIKNISTIQEQNISKSSSIQRQGRAGRTCPGICYKLYSENEYESFVGDSIPEIKRINIDFPVLKLLECGIKDIHQFPFFENPGQQVLQNSILNLKRLGAISKDEQVTQLGKIVQFTELEPFQVRCIIEGAQRGVLDQVLNILAVMTDYQTLFKRVDKDQREARQYQRSQLEKDIKEFNNEYKSDFLFYNFLFNKILTGFQKERNYIQNNNIRGPIFSNIYQYRQYLSQVISKVKGQFPTEFTVENSLLVESENERIQKSMFCNFFNQIAIFTGSRAIGFSNIYSDITFFIHPYSKYAKEQFEEGDLLFYGRIENKETLNFAKHVSVFKKDWLNDDRIVPNYMKDEILQVLSRKLNPRYICNIEVSRYILLVFIKKYQDSIFNQFMAINKRNPQARLFMIIDDNTCSIKIMSSAEGEKVFKEMKIEEEIMKLINQERLLQKKNIFIQKYKETQNYVVFGQGYEILDILLPHEFVRVRVFNFPRNINGQKVTENVVEQFFNLKANPNYSSVSIQSSERNFGVIITFITYESANQFIYQANLQMPDQFKDVYVQGFPESRAQLKSEKVSIVAEWPIWKSKGQGQIIFGNQHDRDATYQGLLYRTINGYIVNVYKYDPPLKPNQISKSYIINLGNLSPLTSEQDFRPFIINLYQGFENVIIRREPIQWNETQKLENMQKFTTELKALISNVANENDREQVQINYDYGKKGYIKARIQFPKEIQAEQFLQLCNNRNFGQGKLSLQIQNQCKLALKIRAFETIKEQYNDLVNKYKENAKFDAKYADYEVLITLTTNVFQQQNILTNAQQTQNLFQLISQQLKNIIKPYIINFDVHPRDFAQQYEQQIKTFENTQNELKIFILPTPKKAEVSVWFHYTDEEVKQNTIKQLNVVFAHLISSQKILKKKHFNQKSLFDKLQQLQNQNIINSFQDKQDFVILIGGKSNLQRALQQLNQDCKLKKSEEHCKICYEDKSIERIDQCGCSYCQDCLLQLVLSSAVQSKFISCPDHKEVPINLEDIKDIISQTDEEKIIQDKINLQIDIWKNNKVNKQKFIRCSSVNCDSFFGRKYYDNKDAEIDPDMPSSLKCSECYQSFCLKDTTKESMKLHNYHSFGRCDSLEDQQVIEQLKQMNAKQCPACKEIIIKSMGCNHMTCRCGAHFCYECLFFPNPSTAQLVYSHMSSARH